MTGSGKSPDRNEPGVQLIMQVMFALFTLSTTILFVGRFLFLEYDLPALHELRESTGAATVIDDPLTGSWREGRRLWLRVAGAPIPFVVSDKCGGANATMVEAVRAAQQPLTVTFDPHQARENSTLVPYYFVLALRIGSTPLMTYEQCRAAWREDNRLMIYPGVLFLAFLAVAWFRIFRRDKAA